MSDDPQQPTTIDSEPVVPEATGGSAVGSRRPYTTPRLERFGRLSEITRFGGSETVDSGGFGPQAGFPVPPG